MKLIVIDMQKGLLVDGLYDLDGIRRRIVKLIAAARKNNVEVIYVQHDAGPDTGFSAGDKDFEIGDSVAPRKGEKVFVKKINSSFGNKSFTRYLKGSGDDTLMIVGLQTNFCIDATVKSAFERGYRVLIPKGTNSTFDNPYMDGKTTCEYYFNEVWHGTFAECVSLSKAIELLKNAGDVKTNG
jgi:nicotinamidase-related amidase